MKEVTSVSVKALRKMPAGKFVGTEETRTMDGKWVMAVVWWTEGCAKFFHPRTGDYLGEQG